MCHYILNIKHEKNKWTNHIMLNEKSLVKQLGTRLNALMKISRVTSRPQLSASLTITSSTVRHRNVIIRTETPRKEHRPATAIPSLAKIIWQC